MSSIRTKITFLAVIQVLIALVIATMLAVVAINNLGNSSTSQILSLLCETGEKNLDTYFESVEQSVETVSSYAMEDLRSTDIENLEEHLNRMKDILEKTANNTAGILTYYYRIDPQVSDSKGFWFVNLDGEGFVEHEVTDISQYDTNDTSQLVWFTVPKATGETVWQPPYITENLDKRVLSYNVPIYKDNQFIGVIGIEIDYSTMVEEVDNITLYENGYAFINDDEGNIVYHPHIDVASMPEDEKPAVPEGLISDSEIVKYSFDGVEKEAAWRPLSNGMRLNVTVPLDEINGGWHSLVNQVIVISAILLLAFMVITMSLSGRITGPLRKLTEAARLVNKGNYDFELTYDGDDEVGILTHTFKELVSHMKVYIGELNSLAYADALTSVHNKGAFDVHVRRLQKKLNESEGNVEFAVAVFDCDHLKDINDRFGHDKGNDYLKLSCSIICNVFRHSPVFRLGGDEFAVILQKEDYRNRDDLGSEFEDACAKKRAESDDAWEQVSVSMGLAVYDRNLDECVEDVTHRADRLMYANKAFRDTAPPSGE